MGAEAAGFNRGVALAAYGQQAIEPQPAVLGRCGGGEAGPHAAAGVGGQGELAYQQQAATGFGERQVHAALGVGEHPIAQQAFGHALGPGFVVARLHRHEGQQAGADGAKGGAVHLYLGMGDALDEGNHGRSLSWRLPGSAGLLYTRDMSPSAIAGQLIYAAAWCLGRLPLSWQQGLGVAAGWLAYRANAREAKVARRNLELIWPGATHAEREAQVRTILMQTGRNGFESIRVWTRSIADNLRLIRSVHGEAPLAAAEAAGRGHIVVAPHYGNLEVVIAYMASRGSVSLVYRVPDSAAGKVFLELARGSERVSLVPAEGNAMRPLWKTLKSGRMVGMTPDQQPKLGAGEFAPFFGIPALTMTLVPRLAERSGAPVFFAYAERRPDGCFDLHIEPAPAAIASPDIHVALAAMNQAIETIAHRDLGQYQWTYKRYTLRPPGSGETNPYANDPLRTAQK